MARLRDFLERFRPAGVPGAAAPAGVPAEAADEAAELEAVFSALGEVRDRCAREIDTAERAAREIRERGHAEAAALVASARLAAEAERASAASSVLRRSEEENEALMRAAAQAAADVRRRAETLIPREVARVVAEVRSLAGDPP
ncbi:hypothetical protein JOL79_11975 [Microbispora sp. RL4-1S]|uniref:Uncharacterized protein n=1 Tax=Microbispora oryzae TaxID=2806554 RepID=A0A941AJ32_9ACTN|nr:hypothetical protein [Microbispora oryzae]MBP2704532.1 hypothetical protein [Microbispora oryzae]